MRREGMTVREAAEEWVREMNAFPYAMIDKLMKADPNDWQEVTTPAPGDSVYVFDPPEDSEEHYGEIVSYDEESDLYTIELSDGKRVSADDSDFEVNRDDILPMWGWLWSFGDSADDYWLEELDGIRVMSECGFRIYESEEFGYFFGIDGAGYCFYESHWCPLYRARGLQWHDPATEDTLEQLIDKLKEAVGECKGSDLLIQRLAAMKPYDGGIKIGGYFGGFIRDDTAKKLEATGHFRSELHVETVHEMSHDEENRYWSITRTV